MPRVFSPNASDFISSYIRIAAATPHAVTALKDLLLSSSTIQGLVEKSGFLQNTLRPNTTLIPLNMNEILNATHSVVFMRNIRNIFNRNFPTSQAFLIPASFFRTIYGFKNNQDADRFYTGIWTAGSFFTALEAFENKQATTAQKIIPLVYALAGTINLLGTKFATFRAPLIQQIAVIAPFAASIFAVYKRVPDPSFQIANPSVLK